MEKSDLNEENQKNQQALLIILPMKELFLPGYEQALL